MNNLALPEYQKGLIDAYHENVVLYQRFKSRIKKAKFTAGGSLVIGAETGFPVNARPLPEGTDVQVPGKHGYQQMSADVFKLIASVGISEDAMLRLSNDHQAFADLADRELKNCRRSMEIIQNMALHGDTTGRLGIVVGYKSGVSYVDASGKSHSDGLKLYFGNLRQFFGWDGVTMMVPNQVIDVICFNPGQTGNDTVGHGALKLKEAVVQFVSSPAGEAMTDATVSTGNNPVTGVAYATTDVMPYVIVALNNNSGTTCINVEPGADDLGYDVAFMSGAVKTSNITGASAATFSYYLPQGLLSLIDDGSFAPEGGTILTGQNCNGSWAGTTFQGVDRTSAMGGILKARVYTAADWGGGTAGVLQTYCLDDIEAIIDDIEKYGHSGGQVTAMFMTPRMQRSLKRKTQLEQNYLTPVGRDGEIVPGRYVSYYMTRGRKIPIIEISTLPENTIFFMDERQITWQEFIPTEFREYNGCKPWFEPGNRNLQFEAWLQTSYNITVERCDNFARMGDLLDTD